MLWRVAYPQNMSITPIKLQKTRWKSVEGVVHTMYLLLKGKEGRKDGHTEGRKDENNVNPIFLEISNDNNIVIKNTF